MKGIKEIEGMMWGQRRPHTPAAAQLIVAPAHRGRTESCTLRILTDAFTGAHGKAYGDRKIQ